MKYIYYIALICFSNIVLAQDLPLNRKVDWSNAGNQNTSFTPDTTVSILSYGATPNATGNDRQAVVDAINAIKTNPNRKGLVLIPAGTYEIDNTISIPSGIVIRGEGSNVTKLNLNFGGSGASSFDVTGSADASFVPLDASYLTFGSSVIKTQTAFSVNIGDWLEIREANGSWDSNPISWANNSVGQVVKVVNIIGDSIYIEKPLRITYEANLNPEVRKLYPASNIGVECLYVERLDNNTNGNPFNFSFTNAVNCWIKGIESAKSICAHVFTSCSSNISVTNSYFHHSYQYDGVGTRGYGVALTHHTGQCLIENNVFDNLRHAMMVKQGANGNVFAYNFSNVSVRSEFPANYAADISCHGHYPFANLFEGNVANFIWIDNAWGPSGELNTFLRNRLKTYGIVTTTTATNKSNFIGNEIVSTAAFQGMYTLAGANNFEYHNYVQSQLRPAGSGALNDISYYLPQNTRPTFWPYWLYPTIGGQSNYNQNSIPAKDRFSTANISQCNSENALLARINSSSIASHINCTDSAIFTYSNEINYNSCNSPQITIQNSGLSKTITINYSDSAEAQLCTNNNSINLGILTPNNYTIKLIVKLNSIALDSVTKTFTVDTCQITNIQNVNTSPLVSPTITNNEVFITIPNSSNSTNLELYSLNGTLLKKLYFSGNSSNISLLEFPNGMYFLKINNYNTVKIIKQ